MCVFYCLSLSIYSVTGVDTLNTLCVTSPKTKNPMVVFNKFVSKYELNKYAPINVPPKSKLLIGPILPNFSLN